MIGGALALIIVIAVGAYLLSGSDVEDTRMAADNGTVMEAEDAKMENDSMEADEAAMDAETADASYTDGIYEATGNYRSPAGEEEIEISIELEDGMVIAATFEGKTEHPTSAKLQGMFSEGFEAEVVGKSLDEISLTVVNGSSLTPKGFMDALEKIKADAAQS